jgi:succinate dehydrogenase / fumarate reductase cytochrome b subunit
VATETPVAEAAEPTTFWGRNEFLILRLHSLSGLIPVGAYMVVHLLTNASILNGPAAYQGFVYNIHSLGVILPLVEWVFIFIPLIFHAVVGMLIVLNGMPNSGTYRYASNKRYTWQRATGVIAFFFIFWHVFHMHGWIHNEWWITGIAKPAFGAQFRAYNAATSAALAMKHTIIVLLYVVGVLASVFHLANGIWTAGITWGVWISERAQRNASYVCGAFGLLLAVVSLSAIWGFYTLDVDKAAAVERQLQEARIEQGIITREEVELKAFPEGELPLGSRDNAASSASVIAPGEPGGGE